MFKYLFLLSLIYIKASAETGDRLSFQFSVNGEEVHYSLFSFFVMPGEQLQVSSNTTLEFASETLDLIQGTGVGFRIQAPQKPGTYKAVFSAEKERMVLNVLVMTPMREKKGEYLNGYRIGNYPNKPLNNDPIYEKPKGLFEVNESNINLQLTPHFNLSQFVCKQAGYFPKYLVVRERLLLKLEYILELVQAKGIDINTFGFISGYRTPFYNKSIGNVPYSRHVWGGASDIFIDQDKNGHMDDLNKDGKIDEKDVRFFYNLVEREYNKSEYGRFVGGLGFYRKNSRHSGFIHVDVRGKRARW